jgi:hypothetical protein
LLSEYGAFRNENPKYYAGYSEKQGNSDEEIQW